MAEQVPNAAVRATRRLRRSALRNLTCPFVDRGDRPLIAHFGHHKAGTVWFRRVLLETSRAYGLRYRTGTAHPVPADADLVFYAGTGQFERRLLGGRRVRGAHVVRDPRDLVVSGYEYHLVTSEAWAVTPLAAYGGRSYQEHLRSLDEHRGLAAEIDWLLAGTAEQMRRWDYGQPDVLELRYEDVLADETASFERLFRWYGFDDGAVDRGLAVVERLSRRNGGARRSHPIRSSAPGEWRARLAPDHVATLEAGLGDLLVRLGYESGPDR